MSVVSKLLNKHAHSSLCMVAMQAPRARHTQAIVRYFFAPLIKIKSKLIMTLWAACSDFWSRLLPCVPAPCRSKRTRVIHHGMAHLDPALLCLAGKDRHDTGMGRVSPPRQWARSHWRTISTGPTRRPADRHPLHPVHDTLPLAPQPLQDSNVRFRSSVCTSLALLSTL